MKVNQKKFAGAFVCVATLLLVQEVAFNYKRLTVNISRQVRDYKIIELETLQDGVHEFREKVPMYPG